MPRLKALVRRRAELQAADIGRMYGLYAAYYDAISPQRFQADLAGKDFVIELAEGEALGASPRLR